MTTAPNAPKASDDLFYEGPIQHRVYSVQYFFRGLLAVAGLALFIYVKAKGYADWKSYLGHTGLLMLVIGLLGVAVQYLQVISTKWKITSTSIQFERGILSKKIDRLDLYKVKDIAYQQSLFQRMMGEGQVNIVSTDVSDPILEIIGIKEHRALYEKLSAAVDVRRREGRVMSFEGGHIDTHGHGH